MSYANYTKPGGGYAPYAAPTHGYTPQHTPSAAKPPVKEAIKFREIPITGGVGEFHTNHFIGYSAYENVDPVRAALRAARLTEVFRQNFCAIFAEKNVATAVLHPDIKHQGDSTVEFRVGGNVGNSAEKAGGLFHSDWVVMRWDAASTSFYGTTLRRDWKYPGEALLAAALAIVGAKDKPASGKEKPVAQAIGDRLVEVNQHHFLAGRRSWKVGYDDVLHRFYVETAAFERNSLCEYHVVEEFQVMRESIVKLWTNLVDNFESHAPGWMSAPRIPEEVPSGYDTRGNAAYCTGKHKTAAQALGTDWFAPVLLRHPGLVKGLTL